VTTAATVRVLADEVGGSVLGPGAETVITGVADLRSAQPDQLSFLGNAKYEAVARASQAGAILVSEQDAGKLTGTRIQVASPSAAFTQLAARFAPAPPRDEPGVHPTAVVAPDAILGVGVAIGPHAVISARARIGDGAVIGANCFVGEETRIGAQTRLHPLVVVRERCVLGARVILHSGVVIGGDGFGYDFDQATGRHLKIPHTGIVQIDDDVEIGANTTIDRARFGKTHIGEGVKIDNLVMIAHNVVVGPHSIIVSQSGVAGSSTLGRYVTLAAQVGVAGHLQLGDRSTLTAQSGITKDVPAGAVLSGRHALPMRENLKIEALMRRLPELVDRLRKIEARLDGPGGAA
jgi:UDP-3-O-[3-hydroxymyristoyl] glucosamine N-acyltransferase